MAKKINLRDKIFQAKDIKEELVYVEEWDVKVLVRGLNGKSRSEVLNSALTKQGTFDFVKVYPDLVIATSYDPETNEKIFTKEDRDLINEKSGSALEKIASVAVRLSGLNQKAIEDGIKN